MKEQRAVQPDTPITIPTATVSLQQAANYDPDRVLAAVRSCLEPLGGMRGFVSPGQRVLLKPNLLGGFPAERAATTHPAITRAAIKLVQEVGGRALVGDCPGMGTLAQAVKGNGLAPVLAETGAELVDFSEPHEFEAPDNVVARRLTLTKALLGVDVIISLPKLKTHGQMTLTAALKNQFGLVPGSLKSQWHFRLQQPRWLASLILDVNRTARPALAILDAITAMEGAGPSGGSPRHVGALLASRDLAALDTVACWLIGQEPLRVPLLAAARDERFGQTDAKQIRVVGDDWRPLRVADFEKIEQVEDVIHLLPLPDAALNWIRRQWTAHPKIIDGRCTRCGVCEKNCPVKPSAILPRAPGQPVDDHRCIHCYCCHEFCPSQAIDLRVPRMARFLHLHALASGASRLLGILAARSKRR